MRCGSVLLRRRRLALLFAAAASVVTTPAFATDYHWAVPVGTWNNGPNWNPYGEPSAGDNADLDYNSNAVVHVIDNVPGIGTLNVGKGSTLDLEHNDFDDGFVSTGGWCYVGSIQTSSGPGTINVYPRISPFTATGQGHLSVGLGLYLGADGVVNQIGGIVSVTQILHLFGGQYNLGGGTLTSGGIELDRQQSGSQATFTMSGGELTGGIGITASTFKFNGGIFTNSGGLNLYNGGQMLLGAGGGKVLHRTSISIGTASGGGFDGVIDLADNAMIDELPHSAGTISTLIRNGTYDGLNQTCTGIVSSTAIINRGSAHPTTLGYAVASDLGISSFLGQSVSPDATLVRYTYVGDANLDGVVNALDFNALASNYGAAGKSWWQADFNDDGIVNAQDFTALSQNFGEALPAPALGSIVPEPAALSIAAIAALSVMRRRRRVGQVLLG